MRYDIIVEVEKFNPYHDARGRFTSPGNATSFTIRTRAGYQQGQANRAIEREKEKYNKNPKPYKVKTYNGIWVDAYDEVPKGWKRVQGATTAPRGYTWYSNNKSRFSGERRSALIRNKQ